MISLRLSAASCPFIGSLSAQKHESDLVYSWFYVACEDTVYVNGDCSYVFWILICPIVMYKSSQNTYSSPLS